MLGKYFSSQSKAHFYLPGEEIKIDKNTTYSNYLFDGDPLTMVKNRVAFATLVFIFAYLVIAVRLFSVCLSGNHQHDVHEEESQHLQIFAGNPIKRADIVDRNGTIIATSLPTVNLYANPKKVLNPQNAAARLSAILPDIRYEDILAKLKRRNTFVYIKRNLTPSQQYQINALGIPGLEFENGEKRIYPHKELFAHLVGSTNIDNQGIAGIEKQLDERLTQSDIPLTLTIDAGLQDTIRGQLAEAVNKFHAEGAAAILMDVSNGEILSMISLPDYDPNTMNNIPERALFNFATKGVYEPGSVLKIFNAALGLESGKVKVADKFDATQPLKLRYNTIKDYRGENRWLDLQEVLVYSSNIGSARIALKVGKAEQRRFLDNLGFFTPVKNIEVAEKGIPLIPSDKRWGEETTATVGYGYGISITPLHLVSAFSAVVNGGIYHAPTLIKDNPNQDTRRVVSFNTSKQMRKLLRGVVTDGSGKRANVLGYEVAGKTGTANKLVNGHYVDKKVMTSFLATFPASNPQYALFMVMDEPKPLKETWGFVTSGWNTVPTAGKIIATIAPQLNIKANYDLDEQRRNRIIEATYTHGAPGRRSHGLGAPSR